MDHGLRSCHRAVEIWRNLNFVVINNSYFNDSLNINFNKDHNQSGLNASVIPSNVGFIFTIWAIWLRRNAWVINKKNIPSSSSIKNSRLAVTEWFYSKNQPKVGKSSDTPPSYSLSSCQSTIISPHSHYPYNLSPSISSTVPAPLIRHPHLQML